MTPMLDIVFILLIFFIVTATFLQEAGIDMRPPPPSADPPPNEEVDPAIIVQVNNDDQIFVNRLQTEPDRVLSAINSIRAEAPNSAVVLEVYDEASHGVVVTIFDEMKVNEIPVTINRQQDS